MSGKNTPDDNTPPKTWGLEDPYNHPVPLCKDSDPWATCYKVLLREAQCKAWKEDIKNLLIFAGLFSGVVTGFALNSYKSLQPNPMEMTNLLLVQLVSQSNGQSPAPLPPFLASPSSTRVNVFWFLSLMLALTTVLIGITAMQWLSEYQRYSGNLTKKENLAERNMRFEGLQKWYVPQLIAGLPLLLQSALVLFFAGMIEFLISLADPALTISVTIVMTITLLFMIMTTVLPAFQHICLVAVHSLSVSPPCPYKSPQSWVFLRIAFSFYQACMRPDHSTEGNPPAVKHFLTWDQFECHWLGIRDSHGRKDKFWSMQDPSRKDKKGKEAEFDAARGVARVVNQHVLKNNAAYAAYHCFKQLEVSAVGNAFFSIFWEEAPDGYRRCRPLLYPNIFSDDRASVAKDERSMLFLAQFPQTLQVDKEHVFVKHQLELYIRVCTFFFAEGGCHISSNFAEGSGMIRPVAPLIPMLLEGRRSDGKISRCVGTAEKVQLINIFTTFVLWVISGPPVDDINVIRCPDVSSTLIFVFDHSRPRPRPTDQAQIIISEFTHSIQKLAIHLGRGQTNHPLLALSIALSYLYQFSRNSLCLERAVASQLYPGYAKSVKALYDAHQLFSEGFVAAAAKGLLDDYSMEEVGIAIREALPEEEKQGLHDKPEGHVGDRQDSKSSSRKDHESAGHDPSKMV